MAVQEMAENKQPESEVNVNSVNGRQDEEYEYVAVPPDGGFGWVIAIAAMLCNLVCDGTLFAYGPMKLHLQKYFNCSDMLIMMVGSVPCGVYLIVGPIVSGLANRYGCRIIIIIGSIGAAICMALSVLSPNVWVMMVIYGVCGGIFFGMVYLPSVVMVSFYFDKKRPIANGLVTAGTGIGALSFGPLANFLMTLLGWRVGMLIFAAIMLTCVLFGAIMKPLKPKRVLVQREMELNTITEQQALPTSNPETTSEVTTPLLSSNDASTNNQNDGTRGQTDVSPTATRNESSAPVHPSARTRTISVSSQASNSSTAHHRHGVLNPDDAMRPLYKKDALFTGSKLQLHRLSRTSLTNSNPYVNSITNIPAAAYEDEKKISALRAFTDILRSMTDFSILKNKQILLVCIGNIFSMLGYYLPIMCLVSFAVDDLHINPAKASFLMMIFGLCNTIGRFTGGPIAMIPYLSPLGVHNAFLFLAGVFTVLAAYANNFLTCALYAGFCGFAIAPHMSLMPNIICDCVGIDRFTNAFGILFLFRGVTSIIGPPGAGFVKDYTKTYDMAFVIGGTMIIIGAFFHMFLYFVSSEDPEKTNKDEKEEEALQKKKLDV